MIPVCTRRISPVNFVLEFALPDDASNPMVFFGVNQTMRMSDGPASLALTWVFYIFPRILFSQRSSSSDSLSSSDSSASNSFPRLLTSTIAFRHVRPSVSARLEGSAQEPLQRGNTSRCLRDLVTGVIGLVRLTSGDLSSLWRSSRKIVGACTSRKPMCG
jgi:hypothetical protein